MRKRRDLDEVGGGRETETERNLDMDLSLSLSLSPLSPCDRERERIRKEVRDAHARSRHLLQHESGPSRITIDDLERRDRRRIERTRTRKRRDSAGLGVGLGLGLAAAAVLPVAYAAPAPSLRRRNPTSRTLPPKPTRTLLQPQPRQNDPTPAPAPESLNDEPIEYDIKYLTSMSTPTHALPTDVYVVDEQRLPFYMTRNDQGEWTKVDDAWFLYGRQAGDVSTANFGPDEDASATAIPTSAPSGTSQFAITDNLPPGWGIEATRSNFYMTPLIVAMSVILALMIVAGIIFIVIKRRKEHRRAKRRAARLRRKALAAAGLTEEDVQNGGATGVDPALREKLTDIDKIVKKPRKEKERGPTAMIRTKVRSWNQGVLRRRKGGAAGAAGGLGLGPSRSATPSIEVISETDTAKEVQRGSSDTTRTTPTVASHSSHDRGSGSGSGSGEATTSDSNTNETPSSSELSRAVTQPPTGTAAGNATYFPPAYRPASVRSLQMQHTSSSLPVTAGGSRGQAASSLSSGSPSSADATAIGNAAVHPPTAAEKTNAPGYYPAPATEDSEVALAVASRSDGKQRMDAPPPPTVEEAAEENRIRHIATDDKRVLERMRMGGSAPPVRAGFGAVGAEEDGQEQEQEQDQDGPSAPTVEIDEEGFERHNPALDIQDPPPRAMADEAEGSSSLPRPPPQRPSMSYRLYSQDDLASSLGIAPDMHIEGDGDDRHLLPSAPPPAHPDHLAPSAPPMLDDDDEAYVADGPEASAPSAPAFDMGQDEDQDQHHERERERENSESGIEGGDEYARTDTNDTRDSTATTTTTPTPPRGESPIPHPNPNQPRNPSLPLYEP